MSRGQGVASFGAGERDGAMMEYVPAVTAYEDTARKGFRTFISCGGRCFEPFAPDDPAQKQELRVSRAALELRALHEPSDIEVRVEYRILPGEDMGALMRRVTVRNTGGGSITFRLADGMARVIPAGIRNREFREMAAILTPGSTGAAPPSSPRARRRRTRPGWGACAGKISTLPQAGAGP